LADDGELPYGSGCGGVIYLLLERRATAAPLLHVLESAFHARVSLAIATVLEGAETGKRAIASGNGEDIAHPPSANPLESTLSNMALQALERMQSTDQRLTIDRNDTRVWVDYRAARPGLWIFGAGDDAKPILRLARELGWFAAVADGRSNLATRDRFQTADTIITLPTSELPERSESVLSDLKATDAAILITHSFEQDSRILASLLSRDTVPAYVGVLGPQRRTREVLAEATRLLGLEDSPDRIEQWLSRLHAPTGLDVGAETPAAIALSIVAEIQQTLNNGSALPLRQVRAVRPSLTKA
jgi:xanthine/CO dehydrogenase XdhC/CoxF family maturation factor